MRTFHDTAFPTATTQGVRVTVETQFVPERSIADGARYFFAYRIAITNEGGEPLQLRRRHWIITDSIGGIEEVNGDGVVGQQPRIEPGETHQYTSFCVLKSPRGSMHGSYQMFRDDGSCFEAEIPAFALIAPTGEARALMN